MAFKLYAHTTAMGTGVLFKTYNKCRIGVLHKMYGCECGLVMVTDVPFQRMILNAVCVYDSR